MKNKSIIITISISLLIILVLGTLLVIRGNEDSWILDSKGVYIKHGNPSFTPGHVKEQQDIINCAQQLYTSSQLKETLSNSPCLGKCNNYSIDMVNVPRNADDDKIENQCSNYKNGVTNHFLELDKKGNMVRIV